MIVRFKVFRSQSHTFNTLFNKTAAFATSIGRERLISISHSLPTAAFPSLFGGVHVGIATVWYWADEDQEEAPSGASTADEL